MSDDLFTPESALQEITFLVPGEVRGKNDPRARIVDGVNKTTGAAYKFVSHYTDGKTRSYEAKIGSYGMVAKGQVRWNLSKRPIRLDVVATFLIPKSYPKKKHATLPGTAYAGKPDCDNILKCVGDGLSSILFEDDKQISVITLTKRYATSAEGEGLFIKVSECG